MMLPRIPVVAALSLFALLSASAQSKPHVLATSDFAVIRSVRALPTDDGTAVEIISTRPLVPAITRIDNPPRLVIDLPGAQLSRKNKPATFKSSEVAGLRASQFQDEVARVVVDLAQPVQYTWDAAGNRLTIRLRAAEAAKSPSVPAPSSLTPPAIPVSTAASGAVLLAGNRLAAGSSVTAGSDTAVLRLGRGGEVRVCPGTTVSVTPSQNGRSLMLGMSTGSLESHYTLDASSDSILTPDFRILLAGPGEFHYAISADPRGNTCIQALPGNTASVIVSELLGDGTYQVKPNQQVVFKSGQLKTIDTVVPNSCGCPAPAPAVLRTSTTPSDQQMPPKVQLAQSGESAATLPQQKLSSGSETAALPASKPNDVHVQVDVPFVFRAQDSPAKPAAAPSPAPTREAELLPVRNSPRPAILETVALPPPPAKHRGFFGKLKGFFSAVFS
jgi:YD repeat-containing protein